MMTKSEQRCLGSGSRKKYESFLNSQKCFVSFKGVWITETCVFVKLIEHLRSVHFTTCKLYLITKKIYKFRYCEQLYTNVWQLRWNRLIPKKCNYSKVTKKKLESLKIPSTIKKNELVVKYLFLCLSQ